MKKIVGTDLFKSLYYIVNKYKIYYLLGGIACLFVLITLWVFGVFKVTFTSSTATITDVFTTTGLDAQGNPQPPKSIFPLEQSRIYCIVFVSSPKPVNIGVRWFFDNELIFDDKALVNNWRAFFIQPLPGELFEKGNYRIEIYLIKEPIRTIHFSVK